MPGSTEKQVGKILLELADYIENKNAQEKIKIGVTMVGSELGEEEILKGCRLCEKEHSDIEVVPIGGDLSARSLAECEKEAHDQMNSLLKDREIDGALTMHYNFPLGVATVGKMVTPSLGREMFVATTTGATAADRVEGLVRNAVYGLATAKACGIKEPTLGVLNIEGARQMAKVMYEMKENGYHFNESASVREDSGIVMRGNDILTGTPDVMVMDSLTGNVIAKLLSSFCSGGNYENIGFGYGPGAGEDWSHIVSIISRTSGAPVIAKAIKYTAEAVRGNLCREVARELAKAVECGMLDLLAKTNERKSIQKKDDFSKPEKEPVDAEIAGIDIMSIDEAVQLLWEKGVYAESGMGCTGPVVMVSEKEQEGATKILKENRYI